ncbi:MAG: glycosyltransferase family 39 protein, partial [Candidatus Altiarchaeales archaeon]|nr:glycosyltransferase family 39 protein [Candidatus Altiarchaeales archaeon]
MGDDISHAAKSHEISRGTFHINRNSGIHELRILWVYPIALLFYLFGVNDFSAALYPLICDLGSIVLIFYIGRLLLDWRVGLLSAFLLSFFPLHVVYSGQTTPDTVLAFFSALGVYLFIKAENININKHRYYLLSGIVWGLGYLVKETNLILGLFFMAYIIFKTAKDRRINKGYALVFMGFLLIFTVEGFYNYLQTGDFLLRLHSSCRVNEHFDNNPQQDVIASLRAFFPPLEGSFKIILSVLPPSINTFLEFNQPPFAEFGYFYYFIVIASVYMLVKHIKSSYVFLLWIAVLFLYLQLGPMSLNLEHYVLITKLNRYFSIITIPSLLILAYFLLINWSDQNPNTVVRHTRKILSERQNFVSHRKNCFAIGKIPKDFCKQRAEGSFLFLLAKIL